MKTVKKGEPGYEAYKSYMATYMREQYKKHAQWIREYTVSIGCVDCGYDEHHAGLEFDHRDGRKNGERSVSAIASAGLNRIKKEIERCDVVCGTCHNIRTWNRSQSMDL